MDSKDNPYSAPHFDNEEHENTKFQKKSSILPSKAVALFGFMTLLIPCVFVEQDEEMAVNAVMYGVPAGIAALIYSLKNINAGRAKLGDYIGLVLTVVSFCAGIVSIFVL